MRCNFDIFLCFSWETLKVSIAATKFMPMISLGYHSFEILHVGYNSLCYKITELFQAGFALKTLEKHF